MARVVRAGDDIRKGITATWVNKHNKQRTKARENTVDPFSENPITVRCLVSSGIELVRFEAANIVGPAVPYSTFGSGSFQYSTLFTEVNKTLTPNKWGIVQGPCIPNITSKLVVLGITWALFDYTDGHTHVEVVSGALKSGTSGKGIILSPPESEGLPGLILIRDGGEDTVGVVFVLTSDLVGAVGSTASAEVLVSGDPDTSIGETVIVFNTTTQSALTGTVGSAIKVNGVWWALNLGGESNTVGVTFTLTANLAGTVAATATATVDISGDPDTANGTTITVYNTTTKKGYTGAKGWAVNVNGVWWVTEIDQYALISLATLSSDTHDISSGYSDNGKVSRQQTTTISALVAISSYPQSFIPGTLPDLDNPRNLIGLSGDKATVGYNRTNDNWEILELRPSTARIARIKLTDDWPAGTDASSTDFDVISNESEVGGEIPTISSVKDIYSLAMNSKDNDTGIVKYNYVTEGWELVSIEHQATIFRGTIKSPGFSSGTSSTTFSVTPVVPYNGLAPSGDQTVKNIFGWGTGTTGKAIIVIWNPVDEQWEPLQMGCP